MELEDHFDGDDSVVDEDEEQEIDLNDDDFDGDDYDDQDRDLGENVKLKENVEVVDELETMFNLDDPVEFEQSLNYSSYHRKKTKSKIEKISKYEFAKLVGRLAQYITESKIDVLDEMVDLPVVKTGNAIKIALFWVENRKTYKLPLTLKRQLTNTVMEELDPTNLKIEDDYHFTDDNDDTAARFYQNFREKEYNNNA